MHNSYYAAVKRHNKNYPDIFSLILRLETYIIMYFVKERVLNMRNIRNVTPRLEYELNGVHHTVVQKGNVAKKYIYELQQLRQGTDTVVYRAVKNGLNTTFTKNGYRLYLNGIQTGGTAGAHTQTWEYAGPNGNGEWFVGTKPQSDGSHNWDIQIARVKYPSSGTRQYTSNTQLTRLSHINRAGWDYNNDYDGDYLYRVEAAVSPNYDELLIASIDTDGNGYFTLYDLNMINNQMDNNPGGDVSLRLCQIARQKERIKSK